MFLTIFLVMCCIVTPCTFVFISLMSAKKRQQQAAEAQRIRNEQAAKQAAAEKQPPEEPRRPAAPTYREPLTPKTAYSAKESVRSYEKERAKQSSAPAKREEPTTGVTAAPVSVQWNGNTAMQGIVYAEILGKPKALRR